MSTQIPNQKVGTILILRGLPGVGKTTLSEVFKLIHKDSMILSADEFFKNNTTGEYKFDYEKLEEAYKWNFNRFKKAIEIGVPNIIIDNSNIKNFHYHLYLDYGQRHNYLVAVVTIPHNDTSDRELTLRNTHKMSRTTISKMRREFEWEVK